MSDDVPGPTHDEQPTEAPEAASATEAEAATEIAPATEAASATEPAPATEPARRNVFRRVARTRMPEDQGRRQAEVMTAAWNCFRDTAQVKEFLNQSDDALGGTPLDVAMESDEGLAKVVAHLAESGRAAA